jgi:uncharacterized protein YaiE (UPF0345 family)
MDPNGHETFSGGRSALDCQRDRKPALEGAMKHNSYFDGKVQSLSVNAALGPATVGVIVPGHYSFGTDCEEHMHVVAGSLRAKLPGGEWKAYEQGQYFIVPPNVKFEVEAAADVVYLCYYKR